MSFMSSDPGTLLIDDLMRDLSQQNNPQVAALMYGRRLRSSGRIVSDEWMSLSRRNLAKPS